MGLCESALLLIGSVTDHTGWEEMDLTYKDNFIFKK